MRIIGWNVENTHAPDAVRREVAKLIAVHDPDVICLQETYHLHGHLDGLGYQVVQFRPRRGESERAETAILVRDGLRIKGRLAIRLRQHWRGPKAGKRHDGRVYRYVRVKVRRVVWKVGCVHQPFGQGPKAESIAAVQRWFDRARKGRPVAMVGDWNMTKHVVAARLHGVDVAGFGIDLAAVRNASVKATRLGKHGSDHHAIKYDLEEHQ
ncbi:endonuclease/exonuclease/phosphatase family protein [Nocardioides terrisoli]|uniref:endonuclease/exonuclease/phosphatase family protein n=1 Tax=Nocardioides terrisoli TaxID=3388267 RepID=UPI00287B7FEE|nr:endonuclease/exonuclease/phosphatase family protein [Nocardioides marmorisolisilvae]